MNQSPPYGPFIMTTQEEITEAFERYRSWLDGTAKGCSRFCLTPNCKKSFSNFNNNNPRRMP